MKILLRILLLFIGSHLSAQSDIMIKIEYSEFVKFEDKERKKYQYDDRIELVRWNSNNPNEGTYFIQQEIKERKLNESKVKTLSKESLELKYDFTHMNKAILELINYTNKIRNNSRDHSIESLWLELDSTNSYICNRSIIESAPNTFIDTVSLTNFNYNLHQFESDLRYYIKSKKFVNRVKPDQILLEYNKDSLENYIKNQLLLLCSYGIKSYSNTTELFSISWKKRKDNKWNSLNKIISDSGDPVWALVDQEMGSEFRIISPKLDYLSIHSVPFNFRSRSLMNQFYQNKKQLLYMIIDELERKSIVRTLKKEN